MAKSVQLELSKNEERYILECTARELYKALMDTPEFPFDESPQTKDKRKIYTETTHKWHMKQHGAAFVGSKLVVGPNYKGEPLSNPRDVIELIWSMKKRYGPDKEKVIDYAEVVFAEQQFFETYPTIHDIDLALDKCIEKWWDSKYS